MGDSHYNMSQHVINSVHAGDDAYDCAMLEGVLLNLYELPAVDTSKPWWPAFTVDALTVNGKLYFDCSYMKYDALASTRAVFMNQGIAEELNLTIPYDMVREGTWDHGRHAGHVLGGLYRRQRRRREGCRGPLRMGHQRAHLRLHGGLRHRHLQARGRQKIPVSGFLHQLQPEDHHPVLRVVLRRRKRRVVRRERLQQGTWEP